MRVCEGARVDDGLLTMTWIHRIGTFEFIRTFPSVYRGTHIHHPAVTQHVGKHFRVTAAGQVAYADGERIGPLPVDVHVHPGAVQVLLPAGSTIGAPTGAGATASPAAPDGGAICLRVGGVPEQPPAAA